MAVKQLIDIVIEPIMKTSIENIHLAIIEISVEAIIVVIHHYSSHFGS